eukprot:352068-Chlamydomonas_euryale.AAC.4
MSELGRAPRGGRHPRAEADPHRVLLAAQLQRGRRRRGSDSKEGQRRAVHTPPRLSTAVHAVSTECPRMSNAVHDVHRRPALSTGVHRHGPIRLAGANSSAL